MCSEDWSVLSAALHLGTPPCPPGGVQYCGVPFCTPSQLALRTPKAGVLSALQNDLDCWTGALHGVPLQKAC